MPVRGSHKRQTGRHEDIDSPRRWSNRLAITLTPESPALRVPSSDCGVSGATTDPVAYVRRRGFSSYLLRYPPFDRGKDGAYLFVFDKLLFGLPSGRYAIEIWQGDKPNRGDCSIGRVCAEFEVSITGPCTIDANLIECVLAKTPIIRKGTYPVANPIFTPIMDFSVQTCGVIEPNTMALPLKPADALLLCRMTLCRAPQLKLYDGLRVETVEFTGCMGGVPQFERAADGGESYRFPKGSVLSFDWTEDNIRAACEGC